MFQRFIIIFLLTSIDCFSNDNEKPDKLYGKDNFETLFNYSYNLFLNNLPIDSICGIMYDSIQFSSYFYVENEELLSENSNCFYIKFKKIVPDLSTHSDYWIRNLNIVLINRYDSIFVNGNIYSNSENYKSELKEKLLNPNDRENLPQKYIDSIEYFGETPVTKLFVIFDTQMIPDSTNRKASFEKLFEMLRQTIYCIIESRNEVSILKWKTPYEKLTVSQKAAVNKKYPIRIHINFNYKEPTPIPELPEFNFDKIESRFDSLMKEYYKKY